MYADYPISRSLLHWESQSNTALDSPIGLNLVHQTAQGYNILLFAGTEKSTTVEQQFVFLGTVDHVGHESERPIKKV